MKGMSQTRDAHERPAKVNKQARLGIVVVFCRRPTVKTVYTAAYCKRHLVLVVAQLLTRDEVVRSC